jgi:tetratricopeptide (TPR) repeat protein
MPTQSIAAITAYWRGRELLEGPDLPAADAAIAAFRTATSADPSFGLAHAGLGSAYWRKYELTRAPEWARLAVESTEKARQLDPEQPAVRFALARIYRGSGRRDDAIAQLQAVLASQPLSEDAHRLLGEIHGEAGRIDDAVAEFQAALRIRPGFWLTYRAMGLQLLRAGRFTEARAAFDRVIDLQPDLPFGYQLAATVDGTLGNWDAAAKGYEAALHRGGSPATHSSLGTVYYFQGRYKEAAEAYERAIELRPNSAVTHMNLADAYRRLDRAADARREYLRSIELLDGDLAVNPRDGDALSLRAIGEARVGRRAPAREQIDRATALSPENPDVQYQRAVTLGILGDSDEALRALERALALGYSATLARSDDRLDPLRQSKRFDAIVRGRAAQ